MPLTNDDLTAVRRIVREELGRAREADWLDKELQEAEALAEEGRRYRLARYGHDLIDGGLRKQKPS